MSDNRYVRLQDLVFDSFEFDCPVEIEKGALLLDYNTKAILLQLRLNILDINDSQISSVTLKIECRDDAGDEIPEIKPFNDTFRDVNLLGTKSFGDRAPIVLDPRVRRVKVGIEKVTFIDGNVWRSTGEILNIPKQQTIDTLRTDFLEQLYRDIKSLSPESRERIIFIPQPLDEYWLCSCGRPNKNSIVECCRCGITKNWVFENLSEENIQKNLDSYKETVRLLEEDKLVRSTKRKIQRRRVSLILTGIGVISILLFYVVLPFIKYSQASNSLSTKEYDNAISLFENLGEYKNAKELLNEANYQKANDLLANNLYVESIEIFTALQEYKDSENYLMEANYLLATQYVKEENFSKAVWLFENLGDYKDSKELLEQSKYPIALAYYKNGGFYLAYQVFKEIPSYKDSSVYIGKLKTLIGIQGTWEESEYGFEQFVFDGWKYYWVLFPNSSDTSVYEYELEEINVTSDLIVFRPLPGLGYVGKYYRVRNIIEFLHASIDSELDIFKKISNDTSKP